MGRLGRGCADASTGARGGLRPEAPRGRPSSRKLADERGRRADPLHVERHRPHGDLRTRSRTPTTSTSPSTRRPATPSSNAMVEEKRAGFRGSDVVESNTPSMTPPRRGSSPRTSRRAAGLVAGSVARAGSGQVQHVHRRLEHGPGPEGSGAAVVRGARRPEVEGQARARGLRLRLVQDALGAPRGDGQDAGRGRPHLRRHRTQRDLRQRPLADDPARAAGEFDVTAPAYLHTVEH